MILALALLLAVVAWVCYAVARVLDASLEEADRREKSVSAFRSKFYCLFVACSARQT